MPKKFHSPNALDPTLARWRTDLRLRALGAISYRGGSISGQELAAFLGVSPRALRELLTRDGAFAVEYRSEPGKPDRAWYTMRSSAVERPALMPPLRRAATLDGSKAPRITYKGGPTPAVERFAAVPRIAQA